MRIVEQRLTSTEEQLSRVEQKQYFLQENFLHLQKQQEQAYQPNRYPPPFENNFQDNKPSYDSNNTHSMNSVRNVPRSAINYTRRHGLNGFQRAEEKSSYDHDDQYCKRGHDESIEIEEGEQEVHEESDGGESPIPARRAVRM